MIRTSKLRVNSGETLAEAASRSDDKAGDRPVGDKAVKVYVGTSDKPVSPSTSPSFN